MNPLLEDFNTPFKTAPFHSIRQHHYLPAIQEALQVGKSEINAITTNPAEPAFENTILALERRLQVES